MVVVAVVPGAVSSDFCELEEAVEALAAAAAVVVTV